MRSSGPRTCPTVHFRTFQLPCDDVPGTPGVPWSLDCTEGLVVDWVGGYSEGLDEMGA